jgi:hypothetical protein
MNKSIVLNREQIKKLYKIIEHFESFNIDRFEIESSQTSGIGSNINVRFDLFEKNDTNIDITDTKDW